MIQKLLTKIHSFSLKPVNDSQRQKKLRSFRLMLAVTCLVALILFCSLFQKDESMEQPVADAKPVSQNDKLFRYDELLHKQLGYLQKMDEQYAALVTGYSGGSQLDSLNMAIQQEEEYFGTAVENISKNAAVFTDEHIRQQFVTMIASFRSIISGRAAISSLREMIAAKAGGPYDGMGQILNTTATTGERESRIRQMENAAGESKTETETGKQREIAALRLNVNELEDKVAGLTTANNDLKLTNKKLFQQQEAAKLLVKKGHSLQDSIEVLNAEIQLTRVDCNLLKVAADDDAGKKKRLVSESSSILISLAGSGNAAIRRKAKDKVILLNHIAGTRD